MSHQHGKGDEMQPSQRLSQALIIASQPAEARHPRKAALNYPAPRQQHKATLGDGQLDHFQANALRLSISRRLFTRLALVHKCHFDRLAGHLLDLLGQRRDLRPVLLVGRCDQDGQQLTQRVDRQVDFEPLRRLCPS